MHRTYLLLMRLLGRKLGDIGVRAEPAAISFEISREVLRQKKAQDDNSLGSLDHPMARSLDLLTLFLNTTFTSSLQRSSTAIKVQSRSGDK